MANYCYPVVHDFRKILSLDSTRDSNCHNDQSMLSHLPLKPDEYLLKTFTYVGNFILKTVPKVAFKFDQISVIDIKWTPNTSYIAPDPPCSHDSSLPAPERKCIIQGIRLHDSSNLSTYDILLRLNVAQLYSNRLIEMLQRKQSQKETSSEWRLKNSLKKMSMFIDKVLQSYIHKSCTLPVVKDLKKIMKKTLKLIQIAGPKEIKVEFQDGIFVSDFDLVTATLGLSANTVSAMRGIREGSCYHQTDQYHITDLVCKAVEENCSKFNPKTEMVDILVTSGFSSARASILAENLQKDDLFLLQPLTYWVEMYLGYMFEYDIFLSTNYTHFPYYETELDEWHTTNVKRALYDETTGEMVESEFEVQIYSTCRGLESITRDEVAYPPRSVKEGIWYHATDHNSAKDILQDGIRLEKGNGKQDFSSGDGFYLTPYLGFAKEWASKKGGQSNGSIIIFKHNIDAARYKGLDLCLDSDEKWRQVVKYYRSGKRSCLFLCPRNLAAELQRTDYIEGPMSGDQTKCTNADWQPTKKIGDYNQLCIKSQKLADVFSAKIDGIIFLSTNNNLL